MTPGALRGTPGEDGRGLVGNHTSLPGRLVTLDAGDGLMASIQVRPGKWKSGARMIERANRLPGLWTMAGFARQVGLRIERMRIGVTRIAGA